jgi:hypothetical protein
MLMTSENMRAQISPVFQRLMDDVLAKSDGRLLQFVDEVEYIGITEASPNLSDDEGCCTSNDQLVIICLKSLAPINTDKELSIAHELGHARLRFLGFPDEKTISDPVKKQFFELFTGPLRTIMEHAIFYPWLKNDYNIDLYEQKGKPRIINFIKNDLPFVNVKSQDEVMLLMLNYVKHSVETSNTYWLGRLQNVYDKKLIQSKELGEKVLQIMRQLSTATPDAKQ